MSDDTKKRMVGGLILFGILIVVGVLVFGGKSEDPYTISTEDNDGENVVFEIAMPDKTASGSVDGQGKSSSGLNLDIPPPRGIEEDPDSDLVIDLPPPAPIAEAGRPAPTQSSASRPAPTQPTPAPAKPPAKKSSPWVEKNSGQSSAPAKSAPAYKPAPAASGQWVVQAASFSSRENAESLRGRLAARGHKAFVREALVNGNNWYRVRVGPFAQEHEAHQAAVALQGQTGLQVRVMQDN